MTRSSHWLATAALFAISTPARADEVVLQDGRTVYGSTEARGNTLVISTRDGEVSVPRTEVVRVRKAADLKADLVGLASRCGKLSAFSCLHLAHTARDWGLAEDMWGYLDHAQRPRSEPDSRPPAGSAELGVRFFPHDVFTEL